MKKQIKLTGILLMLALLFTCLATPVTAQAASKKRVEITSVKSNISVYAGTTKSLKVKVNTKSTLTYKTSNSKTAKVKNGKLYAYNPGKVKITIKATPKSKKYKTTFKSIYMNIVPGKPAVPAAKRSGKYIVVSIKATKGAQGYKYQYATNSKMKNPKTKITKAKSYKFSASSSKTYYVRVKAYAKSGGKTFYSGWSSIRKVSRSAEPSKPNTPGKPSDHTHKWEKIKKGEVWDWKGCGPDENGYTSNIEIAQDKNGKKIGIHMCAKCYAFYGDPDNDKWEERYWEHAENEDIHHGGYSYYPVYAVYDVYYCKKCENCKRGAFSFYGYYDYSNGGAKWIYLTQWQIEELNLPLR